MAYKNTLDVRRQRALLAPFYREHRRALRSPAHTFNIQARPYALTPFMIAPVLPGETLKKATIQVRSVSDPIVNPLMGWWLHHYLFYVPMSALAAASDFEAMFIDPDRSLAGYQTAADVEWYHGLNGVEWVKLCTQVICNSHFRSEGEVYSDYTIGNMYAAQIRQETWMNSALLTDNQAADMAASVDLDASGTITPEEVRRALMVWQFQMANNMTDMSFEDYCRMHGVRLPEGEDPDVPELIREWTEWTYPTNTIDPTNGRPRSAVSWAISGSADKDRYFKRPGFIIGLQVPRAKVYLKNVDGAAAEYLQTALNWLPAIMADDPNSSLRRETAATGPLQTIVTDSDGYYWDTKDLFVYGDQFLNMALTATDRNICALPLAASLANLRYPSSTDVDAFFVNAAGGYKYVKSDGVVNLHIMGRTWDTTPGVAAA